MFKSRIPSMRELTEEFEEMVWEHTIQLQIAAMKAATLRNTELINRLWPVFVHQK